MSGDLISRQAAIERINKQREHLRPDLYPQDKIGDGAYRICTEFIGRLPSAERHGKWKRDDSWSWRVYACTACGDVCEVPTEWGKPIYEFCPWCGAKMDEKK